MSQTAFNDFIDDKRLKQFQRHFFRQTAFAKLQIRTDNDNRTAGVINALAEQILAETPLLSLQHVGKRPQRPALAGHLLGAETDGIINQGVHGFLQHALFVNDNNVRGIQFQ